MENYMNDKEEQKYQIQADSFIVQIIAESFSLLS